MRPKAWAPKNRVLERRSKQQAYRGPAVRAEGSTSFEEQQPIAADRLPQSGTAARLQADAYLAPSCSTGPNEQIDSMQVCKIQQGLQSCRKAACHVTGMPARPWLVTLIALSVYAVCGQRAVSRCSSQWHRLLIDRWQGFTKEECRH